MSDPQRQKRLLAVLLVVLAVSATYRALQFRGGELGAAASTGGVVRVDGTLAEFQVPHLNLELLRREPATYKPGRDPFRFGVAPPPPERPAPPPKKAPQPKRPEPKPQPARERPTGPTPPRVDFTYLGSFGPTDRRIAVFIKDDEIINAMAGDVLLGVFIVDKIGFESADIKFVEFPDVPGTRLEAGG
jgi:hypothetical protein